MAIGLLQSTAEVVAAAKVVRVDATLDGLIGPAGPQDGSDYRGGRHDSARESRARHVQACDAHIMAGGSMAARNGHAGVDESSERAPAMQEREARQQPAEGVEATKIGSAWQHVERESGGHFISRSGGRRVARREWSDGTVRFTAFHSRQLRKTTLRSETAGGGTAGGWWNGGAVWPSSSNRLPISTSQVSRIAAG